MKIDDTELDRRLAALTREATPEEVVWSRIERRIRPRWRLPAGLAAAAVAVGIAAAIVTRHGPAGPVDDRMQIVVQSEVRAMAASAPEDTVLRRMNSPDALLQAWHENREAIEELERALERDTDNRLLLEFLTEARLRQARLVQQGMTTMERSMTL